MPKITEQSTVEEVAAIVSDALENAGEHTGVPRLSQFSHLKVEWYVEFPPSPLMFGHLYVNPADCAVIELPVGKLRIITPTQSVMDRLAAAYAWKDAQSRDQAIMVAANQDIDWDALKVWFRNEGES